MEILFNNGYLSDFLRNIEQQLYSKIDNYDSEYLFNVNHSDLINHLISEYKLDTPSLNEEKIYVDQEEKDIDVRYDRSRYIRDRSRPFYLKGFSITFHVPYSGDKGLFFLQPSLSTTNPPYANIIEREILISIESLEHDEKKIKNEFNRCLSNIKVYLSRISKDAQQFNDSLKQKIEPRINYRREKLLKDANLVANLGFPLKKRDDAPKTYTVPTVKRKIIPKPLASTEPFKPEPSLNDAEYENIIKDISSMSKVMELSPNAFKNMNEENIRFLFLVPLNMNYEGQATGETFNFEGKTDILIRTEGKNIFIAECAFWKGKKYLTEKIDQLLGYTSWRDTKTAILLFNKKKDLSKVLQQIPDIVSKHSNYKKTIEGYKNETGFRFVLHHRDDKNRELLLTVLVFEVPE